MKLIHKVNISPEAVFDYEECIGLGKLDKYTLKNELEEYIGLNDRLREKHYFHCKYYDDILGQMLRVFVYRKNRLGLMQLWEIAGICQAEHWDEDIEDDGKVRAWLKTGIEYLQGGEDWVVALRVNKILQYTETIFINDILQEVQDAFECERDKETAKEMAFLQSHHFKRQRYRTIKKARNNRIKNKNAR